MSDNTDSADIVRRDFLKTVGAAGTASGIYAGSGLAESVVDASGDVGPVVTNQSDELVSDLGVAYGSDYRQETNELYFVENARGTVSKLDFISDATAVKSYGWATIRGTFSFDFDAGQESTQGGGIPEDSDVWWEIIDTGDRELEPVNGAQLSYLGDVSFRDVSPESLQELSYDTDPIDGSVGSNDLFEGAVFACRTTEGNYAKAEVLNVDEGFDDNESLYDMTILYVTYEVQDGYTRVGTGYTQPMDIVLTSDGERAYVAENGGTLLEVDLDSPDRSAATVVTSGLTEPHQIALDEARNEAYLVEYGSPGRLVRVDLTDGSVTGLFSEAEDPTGLVVDDQREFAYIAEENNSSTSGRLRRIGIRDDTEETLLEGLTNPFHLTWADDAEGAILLTERAPADRVSKFELGDRSLLQLADDLPVGVASVARKTADELLVCTESFIDLIDLIEDLFGIAQPLFMGIGHIPVGEITQSGGGTSPDDVGYATTQGSGYPLQTQDAPFGGTLPLRFNHDRAFQDFGARYYRLYVDGSEPRESWRALQWDPLIGRYQPVPVSPSSNGFYEVHRPGNLWYRPQRGYELNTRAFSNGVHTIAVEFYERRDPTTQVARETVDIRIDNRQPRARLGDIVHKTSENPLEVETVDACAIVDQETDDFKFEITAEEPEGHLRKWQVDAFWGTNRSDRVAEDSYANHNSGSGDTEWTGLNSTQVPQSSWWTAQTRRCAHTFRLLAWDRTVNGRHYIHRSGFRKSLTLLLP